MDGVFLCIDVLLTPLWAILFITIYRFSKTWSVAGYGGSAEWRPQAWACVFEQSLLLLIDAACLFVDILLTPLWAMLLLSGTPPMAGTLAFVAGRHIVYPFVLFLFFVHSLPISNCMGGGGLWRHGRVAW